MHFGSFALPCVGVHIGVGQKLGSIWYFLGALTISRLVGLVSPSFGSSYLVYFVVAKACPLD